MPCYNFVEEFFHSLFFACQYCRDNMPCFQKCSCKKLTKIKRVRYYEQEAPFFCPEVYFMLKLPNQELSVLYVGSTLNYGARLSLYVSHMLRVNMTRDLAHLQLSDIQREIKPICQTFDLQEERILIRRT